MKNIFKRNKTAYEKLYKIELKKNQVLEEEFKKLEEEFEKETDGFAEDYSLLSKDFVDVCEENDQLKEKLRSLKQQQTEHMFYLQKGGCRVDEFLKEQYEEYKIIAMKSNNIACSERLIYDLKKIFKGDISFVYDEFAKYTRVTIKNDKYLIKVDYEYINNFNYDAVKADVFHNVVSGFAADDE